MATPGLIPETFAALVANAGSPITDWPFSYLSPAAKFADRYEAPIDLATPSGDRQVVIGRVGHILGSLVRLKQLGQQSAYTNTAKYELLMDVGDEAAAKAWGQMRDVNLALSVEPEIVQDKNHSSLTRHAVPLRILGVEQPIFSPRTQGFGSYRSRSAARAEGYVQGVVLNSPPSSDAYDYLRLNLGRRSVPATVACLSPCAITASGVLKKPTAGDMVRARVTRHLDHPDRFILGQYEYLFIAERRETSE